MCLIGMHGMERALVPVEALHLYGSLHAPAAHVCWCSIADTARCCGPYYTSRHMQHGWALLNVCGPIRCPALCIARLVCSVTIFRWSSRTAAAHAGLRMHAPMHPCMLSCMLCTLCLLLHATFESFQAHALSAPLDITSHSHAISLLVPTEFVSYGVL